MKFHNLVEEEGHESLFSLEQKVAAVGEIAPPQKTAKLPASFRLWRKIFPTVYYGWVMVFACAVIWWTSSPGTTYSLGFFVDFYIGEVDDPEKRSLVSTYFLVSTIITSITGPLFGRSIDKFGTRLINTIVVPLFAVSIFLLSVVPSVHLLLPLFVVISVSISTFSLSINAIIGQFFIKKKGRASAIANFVGALTYLTLPTLNILAQSYSWQTVILMEAAFVMFSGTLISLITVPTPESIGLLPDGDVGEGGDVEIAEGEPEMNFTVRETMKTKVFWLITLSFATLGLLYAGFNLHHVLIFQENGLDGAEAGSVAYLSVTVVSLIANIAGGFIIDNLPNQKIRTCALATGAGAGAGISLIFATGRGTVILFGIALGLMDAFLYLLQSTIFSSIFGRRNVATISAVSMGFFTSAFGIGPLLFAVCNQIFGSFRYVLILLSGLLVIESALLMVPWELKTPQRIMTLNEDRL